jgi:hypothetical protein
MMKGVDSVTEAMMMGMGMSVPKGRILTLRYEGIGASGGQIPATKGPQPDMTGDALRIEFRAPDGDVYEHYVPNGDFGFQNPALQIMGLCGVKPSDFDGPSIDVRESDILVPLVYDDSEGYLIQNAALQQGARALEEAEWIPTPSREEEAAQNATDDVDGDVVTVDVGGVDGDSTD